MLTTKREFVAVGVIALMALAGLYVVWWLNIVGVRTSSPLASVATAFDPPPSYPGYRWTRNGRAVTPGELVTAEGAAHCGSQSATYLTIGWPPGTVSDTAEHARLYIRDPNGVLGNRFRELLDRHATLPQDAHATGYKYGALEIYLSPSDEDRAIYVVAGRSAERWPRSDPMALTLCQ